MSLGTYNELVAAVADWINRADGDDDVTARVPDFVALAEADFRPKVRSRYLVTSTTPAQIPSSGEIILPADFAALREEPILVDMQDVDMYPLRNYSETYGIKVNYGWPGVPVTDYTIQGLTMRVRPWSETTELKYRLIYFAKPPPLSASQQTNDILTNYPGLYLYGSLVHASPFLNEDQRNPVWGQKYQEILGEIEDETIVSQYGAVAAGMPE